MAKHFIMLYVYAYVLPLKRQQQVRHRTFFSSKPSDVHKLLQKNSAFVRSHLPDMFFYMNLHQRSRKEKQLIVTLPGSAAIELKLMCNPIFRDS